MRVLIAALMMLSGQAMAQIVPCAPNESNCFSGNLVNVTGQAASQKWPIDMSAFNGSRVSAQVVSSSQNFTAATFSDGQVCAGAITIASNAGLQNPGGSVTACGHTFVSGADFAVVTLSSMTAKNLKTAMGTYCGSLTLSQATGSSIVYATSTLDSSSLCNFSSSNQAYISTAATATGINSGATLGSAVIVSSLTTGLTTGLQVLYSTGGVNILGGLTNQTTYYASPVSAYSFQLMATSTDSIAGTSGIVITSTNTNTAAKTFTLTPLAWSGSASLVFQASDDNVNWITAPSTGTVSISSSSAAGDVGVDFGFFNYRWLRLNFTAPTSGGENLTVPVAIKQDGIGKF